MVHNKISLDQAAVYLIQVQGKLDERWNSTFDGLTIQSDVSTSGLTVTTLTGSIPDQAALHGLLSLVRDLGLPLIKVELISTLIGNREDISGTEE